MLTIRGKWWGPGYWGMIALKTLLGRRVDDDRADLPRFWEVIMLNEETIMDYVADRAVNRMVVI